MGMKIRLDSFEIPADEFDNFCLKNRLGRKTARAIIKDMMEQRVLSYSRNIEMLSSDVDKQIHLNESAWALRHSPRKGMTEKEIKETQYKMFKGEKR